MPKYSFRFAILGIEAIVRRIFPIAVLVMALLVAQQAEGDLCIYRPHKVRRICGVIVTPSGEPIPHEKVSVLKNETLIKDTETDDAGEFDFGGIAAGKYELDVDIGGFRHARYELILLKPTGSCRHAIRVQMYIGMHCEPDITVMNHPEGIFSAASIGDLKKVKTFIEDDPDAIINEDNEGRTPLYLAAANGHKDAVELLIADGSYINDSDNKSMTPLHRAAENGHKDVTEVLLANKADVNVRDENGLMPLHYAAQKGHKDVAELLLAKDAEADARDSGGQTPTLSRFYTVECFGGFCFILDVQQIDDGTLVRLVQTQKMADPCGPITIVKAIEKSLPQITLSQLVGNNNPCAIPSDIIQQSTKANAEILGPKLGIIASCGDEERPICLPSLNGLDLWDYEPEVGRFRKDENSYKKAVDYSKSQNPQIAALGDLEGQITKSVFGITPVINHFPLVLDDKFQLFGQSLIPELRSGKYDKGLFCGNNSGTTSEISFKEILRDYVPKEKVPVYIGKLVHAEQFHFIKYVAPPYPELALRGRVQAKTNLELVVDPKTGIVTDVQVISSEHPLMKDAGVKAVLQWQFDPSFHKLERTIKITLDFSFNCLSSTN